MAMPLGRKVKQGRRNRATVRADAVYTDSEVVVKVVKL